MTFRYEVVTKQKRTDQVGLRLQCDEQRQAEEIHRVLRQAGFTISRLMTATHPDYTHFVYVTVTDTELSNTVSKIEAHIKALNDGSVVKEEPNVKNFESWKNQFRKAIKQLNNDYVSPTSSVQEINQSRLEQKIAAGRTIEVEEHLLHQANDNDSNALRTLIALYTNTGQNEQLVELCKAKRSCVLALPVSGRLVEQLVFAHLQHYKQTNAPELLHSAQTLAQEFLPELERLRQANGVRRLLNQSHSPQEQLPTVEGGTLNEKLLQLLEIEPGDRIPQLEFLSKRYPKAINVQIALANSYAVTDNTTRALQIYESILEKTEEVQQRYAEVLLASERFQKVIERLPDAISELSPALAGLRGAALYNLGQKTQSREFLEKAWQEGERKVQILLPLAKLWATVGDPVKAGEAYQILQETANEKLTLEDHALIAKVANLDGFGDISNEQKVNYYEKYVTLAGVSLLNLPEAEEILKDRLDLWQELHNSEGLLNAYADWLDWLVNARRWEDLDKELDNLRHRGAQQQISCQQYFELLESLEIHINFQPTLRQSLANDYFGLAIAEIDNALRQGKTEAPFFQDLKRALLCLDSKLVNDVIGYRQQRQAEAAKFEIQVVSDENIVLTTPKLASISLALVGGHQATRREVIRELCEGYGLKHYVEVPPSSEAYINRSSVQGQISNCHLIAVIAGYIGHDLSQIVSDLQKNGALAGQVLFLACRGKSGIVRSIIQKVQQENG